MVRTNFYLDTRRKSATHDVNPLRINITRGSKTAALALGISLKTSQWNVKTHKIGSHPDAAMLNLFIAKRKIEVDTIILRLRESGELAKMTPIAIRDYVAAQIMPERFDAPAPEPAPEPETFLKWFDLFVERKRERTRGLYLATRRRLVAWLGIDALAQLTFEDLKLGWLEDCEAFLRKTERANSAAIHLRNIRAVVNYAIDHEVTTVYAFRRFKIKTEMTRKRNFDVETMRCIFRHRCEEEWQQKYLDFFKLTFLLIGINVVDLFSVRKITSGRIDYIRAKTHRPYSIKVEPEALAIINHYKGSHSLLDFTEHYANYRSFYMNLCSGLNKIKGQLGLDELTTYWARHSWATIARKIGVSKDTIAQALGHGSHDVTNIYIEYDAEAVDRANRRVIDFVFYNRL